jgi:hypothetical protein
MSVRATTFGNLAAFTCAAAAIGLTAERSSAQSVIWDNGPLITQANGGCPADPNTHHDSELQNIAPVNANTLGFTVNNPTFRLADDFTLLGGTTVSSLTVYGYQTFAAPPTTFPPASTFTGMFVQIWNGRPGDTGSSVIFGDTTTNRLTSTAFSGIYRSAEAGTGIDLCIRPLMANVAVFSPPLSLAAGHYWIEYGLTGSTASGPFGPPVTVPGAWYAGNARQLNVATATWVNLNDGGNGQQGDLPFLLHGNACLLPLSCYCPADIAPVGGNGVVNVDDLLVTIATWGANGNPQGPRPQGDVAPLPNGNCMVNVDDLLGVINGWGACPAATGSCCLDDGSCLSNQTVAQCASAEGTYNGNCTQCPNVVCPIRPENNKCIEAQLVKEGTTPWNNAFATTDGPLGIPGNGCEDQLTRDIWFDYQATQTGAVVIDTNGSTGNTDSVLVVYDTWACPPGAPLGCNDDISASAPINTNSRVTIAVTAGQQIKIRVGSFGGGPEGAGVLNIASFDNDICGGAQHVNVPGTASGSLANATIDDTAPFCNGLAANAGKWYTVTGNGSTLTATTCASPGQIWNAYLSIYCGFNCNDLTCVTAVDDNSCSFHETISWCSTAGQKYWILVHTDSGTSPEDFVLGITSGATCSSAVGCGCLQCPAGSVAEGEPCAGTAYVDATNGGCNVTPAVFGSISANGAAICGIGSTYVTATGGNARDLDWYTFTVTTAGTYRVQGNSSFPANFFILQNAALNITTCGTTSTVTGSLVASTGNACLGEVTSTGVTLQPGTYAVVVGPQVFTGFLCTPNLENNRYYVRLLNP